MTERALHVVDLGRMPYAEALELQRAAAKARISGAMDQDVLLLVEHPSVITTGRSSKQGHLLASMQKLDALGVELYDVDRGGDVTYHGPGQLVGYPIVDLKRHKEDLHWYLRQIESALIDAVSGFGIVATRNPGLTGVWVRDATRALSAESRDEGPASMPFSALGARPSALPSTPLAPRPSPLRKLASIGVHARDWVTWHGFALNVTTDLSYFDLLIPCGIQDVTMTSLERELGRAAPDMATVRAAVAEAMGEAFQLTPGAVTFPQFRLRLDAGVVAT